jgi:mono/diheme cytochrome c family protein
VEAGQRIFDQATPPCGSCHTLEEAGAGGLVGPSLDALRPEIDTVVNAVTNGVGVMPAYGETLSPQEISDLARYVVEASR